LERQQAIERYSKLRLTSLSQKEREKQLNRMTYENWSHAEGWNSLSKSIQQEFEKEQGIENPELEKYDAILMVWFKYIFQSVSNKFLCQKLNIESIVEEPKKMEPCPCCGYRTNGGKRGNYEICRICMWEDDGRDNQNSSETAGANGENSLAIGRYNYLIHGLYDPERTDLMKYKSKESLYKKGRVFEILDNRFLIEKGTTWKCKITIPNETL